MTVLFSNCPNAKSYTINFFYEHGPATKSAQLACPFFTDLTPLKVLKESGCEQIRLLVRLCETTSPQALTEARTMAGIDIRYFTGSDFHAKFYIVGDVALIGSANLTSSGLNKNRELSLVVRSENEIFDDIPALFDELWNSASVLTTDALDNFRYWWKQNSGGKLPPIDGVPPCSPVTIAVKSQVANRTRTYLETFRALYVEKLIPAHALVESIYDELGKRHPNFVGYSRAYEMDRFLYWVRGFTTDEDLPTHPLRTGNDLAQNVRKHVSEWFKVPDTNLKIDEDRVHRIDRLQSLFEDASLLEMAGMDEIVDVVQGCAAFVEMLRFTKGGLENHLNAFRKDNDIDKIRNSFRHLAFGGGDYVQRIYDCIYLPEYKLAHWGRNSTFELFGWINKDGAPPLNGRIIKALRYLGFDVPV